MPKPPTKTRTHDSNGHAGNSPVPRGNSRLVEYLTSRLSPGTDAIKIGSGTDAGEDVQAGSMADVMQRVDGIRYLVKGWLPFGMLTMLLAPPGTGKSAFTLYGLARPIIVGGIKWFNGMKGPEKAGYVLWCDTEGTAAITVQRIKDWGLPAERIKVPFEDDPLMSINLTSEEHAERIEAIVNRYRIKLVVVDSLRGAHDGEENNSRVGQVLKCLASMAERTNAAVVVIHHTRKIAEDEELSADSSRGSNAIVAMVRSQLGIDKPDRESDWCRLQMLKENLGLKPRPIGFCISSEGLEFGQAPERPHKETIRDNAEDRMRALMEPGKWVPAGPLLKQLRKEFSANAIQRAREDLGITKPRNVRKVGKKWEWRLPSQHTTDRQGQFVVS